MGTVVQFERQSSEGMVVHSAAVPSLHGTPGIDVERIEEAISKCNFALVCIVKMLGGIEELEKLDRIEQSNREAIERLVRSVRLQLPLQLVTLAHSLFVLRDIAGRSSKILGYPQSLVAERQDCADT